MAGIHQTSSVSEAAHHDRPLFPSVHRLLLEYASSIKNPSEIKGTGIRGMITKGDVLAYLGKASGPLGTYAGKEPKPETAMTSAAAEVVKVSSQFNLLQWDSDRPGILSLWTDLVFVNSSLPISFRHLWKRVMPQVCILPIHDIRDWLGTYHSGPTAPPTFDSIIEDYISYPAPSTLITPPLVAKRSAGDAYLDGLYWRVIVDWIRASIQLPKVGSIMVNVQYTGAIGKIFID